MSERSVVIETTSGQVLRKIGGDPAQIAQQAQAGESIFLLMDDDGASFEEAYLVVSETGVLEPSPAAPVDFEAPTYEMALVPA